MFARQWFKTDEQLLPGTVLYSSPRRFQLWAQTVSHGQLLFRSPRDQMNVTRVDLMFKPVDAQMTRSIYSGLQIRCATTAESELLLEETVPTSLHGGGRLFLIDSAGTTDWVAAMAVGWCEDDSTADISAFTYHDKDMPPPVAPRILDGADGGLGPHLASIEEVIATIRAGGSRPSQGHAHIHLIMVKLTFDDRDHTGVAGGFVTREAAERHLARTPPQPGVESWIDVVPVNLS